MKQLRLSAPLAALCLILPFCAPARAETNASFGVVATIVDRSTARAQEAARRAAEGNVLASLSAGVLRREDGVRALLDQACETFGMTGAALVETSPGPGGAQQVTHERALGGDRVDRVER